MRQAVESTVRCEQDGPRAETISRPSGNRSVNNAPRNTYRTADGRWLAVSTSSQSVAERVLRLVGRADLIDRPLQPLVGFKLVGDVHVRTDQLGRIAVTIDDRMPYGVHAPYRSVRKNYPKIHLEI